MQGGPVYGTMGVRGTSAHWWSAIAALTATHYGRNRMMCETRERERIQRAVPLKVDLLAELDLFNT